MANRQPTGPPPPPTVQRIRLQYAKRGRLRFTSHRDIARVFERAIRRAALPIAHSAGFSPHPKISWVGAAPTGVASEAEYVEIGLTAARSLDDVARDLDAVLPPGLDIVAAVNAGPGSLPERMEASRWELRLDGADRDQVRAAVAAFWAAPEVLVSRRTKGGMRDVDTRAATLALWEAEPQLRGCVILGAVVRHTTPVVRPDDVLTGLRAVAPLELGAPLVATRLAQGPLRPGEGDAEFGLDDPLAPDRAHAEREAVIPA
jgi:radical SAM-linked protein